MVWSQWTDNEGDNMTHASNYYVTAFYKFLKLADLPKIQKDLENKTFEVARRDTLTKEVQPAEGIVTYVQDLLEQIQADLFNKAIDYRATHTTEVSNFDEFKDVLDNKGGFVSAHWDGTSETEEKIKELTKATIRCIALDRKEEVGSCVFTGKPSSGRVLFAKAY